MIVKAEHFHPMRGHVEDGCIIVAPTGKEFSLVNTVRGWMINGPDGKPVSGYLPSAHEVTFFVVNALQSH